MTGKETQRDAEVSQLSTQVLQRPIDPRFVAIQHHHTTTTTGRDDNDSVD